MTVNTDNENKSKGTTWGPRLFLTTVAITLVFFWWLLIFSGGVGGHHGYKMNEFVDEAAKKTPEVAD